MKIHINNWVLGVATLTDVSGNEVVYVAQTEEEFDVIIAAGGMVSGK